MDQVSKHPKIMHFSNSEVFEMPDDAGELRSDVYFSAFGRTYRLVCLSDKAFVIRLRQSLVLIDTKRSTVFHILCNGAVFTVGIEDWKREPFAEDLVFFSDSGLILLNEGGVRQVNFLSLNEYHISIDFSEIGERFVLFELGDSRVIRRSIKDLDELIGQSILPGCPKLATFHEGAISYALTSEP